MINNSPLVTVIIPTYNRAQYIIDAINSAKRQTYSNTQIIVVDDGSTDNTESILKNISDIEYYFKENGGQASARNLGLIHSKGTIIASLDSDDIWEDYFLDTLVSRMEEYKLDFVFANWEQQNKHSNFFNYMPYNKDILPFIDKINENWIHFDAAELREIYIKGCVSPSSSFLIYKDLLDKGWNEKINIGDDWYMQLNTVIYKPCTAAFYTLPLWKKRINDNNVCDHRSSHEVLNLLYIEDVKCFIQDFHHQLNDYEKGILLKKYTQALVSSSVIKIFKKNDFKSGVIQLKKAILLQPKITVPLSIKFISYKIKRKFIIAVLNNNKWKQN